MSKLDELARQALSNIDPHPDEDCDCFLCEDGRKQIRAALLAYGEAVRERAAGAADAERLVDATDEPQDEAYDAAIGHAIKAIRSLNLEEI